MLNLENYRYGFNAKEKDENGEFGNLTHYDYGFRIYNPSIGRFLSVDPLARDYAYYSPYHFAGGNPIKFIDLDGLEPYDPTWIFKLTGFAQEVTASTAKGVINLYQRAANNPNHAGYGYSSDMKAPTMSQLQEYDINWRRVLDPYYQIESFSKNLVYGTQGVVMGAYNGDGEQFARAIPSVLASYGILVMKIKVPGSVSSRYAGRARRRTTERGAELATDPSRPYVISSVTDEATGIVYQGKNRAITSLDDVHPVLREKLPAKTLEKWTTYNCAECDAFNSALKNGAKWDDLVDMHTMRYDKHKKSYVDMERCDNCKVSYDG